MQFNKESVAIKCIHINIICRKQSVSVWHRSKNTKHNFEAQSDPIPMMPPNLVHNIWAQLPNEIWERILDDVDSRGLESAQETCVAWKNIVIAYTLNGRLLNRAKVSLV